MPKPIYIANELNLPGLLWRVLLGQRPVLLTTEPLLWISRRPLEWVEATLRRKKLIVGLEAISKDFPWLPVFPLETARTLGVMHEIEGPAQDVLLGSVTDDPFGYVYPAKKTITDYTQKIKNIILIAQWTSANLPHDKWEWLGLPDHFDLLWRLVHSTAPNIVQRKGFWIPRSILNFLNTIVTMVICVLWCISRIRFTGLETKTMRLAVDHMNPIDGEMSRYVLDDPKNGLIVFRDSSRQRTARGQDTRLPSCTVQDSRLSISEAVELCGQCLRHTNWMFSTFRRLDTPLFSRLCTMVLKRLKYVGFFKRYQPQFFWARDDYSIDHIFRTQELRKVGGCSLGINHGLPLNTHASMWREIDFDIYYTYGQQLYDDIYKNTWATGIAVKPVGTLSLTPQRKKRLHDQRPRDIAYFPTALQPFDKMFDEAFMVARHFPDRRFWVRMKPGRLPHFNRKYRDIMRNAPDNVVAHIEDEPYDLLLSVSYAIGFSTLFAEALQFRVRTFTFDMHPEIEHLYTRKFEGLAMPDSESIIRRIEAIESGQETFDFDRYDNLIKMNGPNPFDVIREDIGLPPKTTSSNGTEERVLETTCGD